MFTNIFNKQISPAQPAIIMAIGIFLTSTIDAFPFLDVYLGPYFTIGLFIIWIITYLYLIKQFFNSDFLIPFIKNPIVSFSMGTWIAGVSVLANILAKYIPNFKTIFLSMAFINLILWFFFCIICLYNYSCLIKTKQHIKNVHGIILLATVGTQSIVILFRNVFPSFPTSFYIILISLGICFYLIGMFLIGKRYLLNRDWSIANDWNNTNCIIHGALSITGFAITVVGLLSARLLIIFWIFVFSLFIAVETIEIIRAILRVKLYGFKKGLLTYHVTQWSRNFTFGMFYAFSAAMNRGHFYNLPIKFIQFQVNTLACLAWIVLIALIIQIFLYLNYSLIKIKQ